MTKGTAKKRANKIDMGTLGNKPCERLLNQILMETDDARTTSLVASELQQLRGYFKNLLPLKGNWAFYVFMVSLVWKHHKETFKKQESKLPKIVFTVACCCYKALYREAMEIKHDKDVDEVGCGAHVSPRGDVSCGCCPDGL